MLNKFKISFVCFRFPGITDWKFIMMNFEERIQVPVKKFSQSLYGNLVLAGGVVVRKISMRKQILQQYKNVFTKNHFLYYLYQIFQTLIDGS